MSLCNSIKSSFVDAVIGLIDAPYTVSEGDGSALLLVGLIEGSNSIQGDVIMTLSINDLTAVGMPVSENNCSQCYNNYNN